MQKQVRERIATLRMARESLLAQAHAASGAIQELENVLRMMEVSDRDEKAALGAGEGLRSAPEPDTETRSGGSGGSEAN